MIICVCATVPHLYKEGVKNALDILAPKAGVSQEVPWYIIMHVEIYEKQSSAENEEAERLSAKGNLPCFRAFFLGFLRKLWSAEIFGEFLESTADRSRIPVEIKSREWQAKITNTSCENELYINIEFIGLFTLATPPPPWPRSYFFYSYGKSKPRLLPSKPFSFLFIYTHISI